ncbi:MAG: glycerophosphodiester phosphodiesterase [Planctomycetes bacterium]|nr:glycerophosphodiester phosphodiesterase [Planctomycetota bacterium]
MLLLSHRGYHEAVPENTLEAFERALALGIDGIETDIRLSADEKLILFHDRLAPDGRAIAALPHAELSAQMDYRVPTLEEALESWGDILWNLEIKTPQAVPGTMAVLKHYQHTRRILVTSFWHPVIEEMSSQLAVDYGLLLAHCPAAPLLPQGWLEAHPRMRTVVWDYEFFDPSRALQATGSGIRNFVYGAKSLPEHQKVMEWKMDGIITDHPEFIR